MTSHNVKKKNHYLPVEDYGIIGNMRTVALISITGSIDFFCPRKFDDASIFASLLDAEKGGCFKICPKDTHEQDPALKQHYWPDTNVLVTRFLCQDGVLEVTDFMPVSTEEQEEKEKEQANENENEKDKNPHQNAHWLVRRVKMVRGSFPVEICCAPRFNYGRDAHTARKHKQDNGDCVLFESDTYSFALLSSIEMGIEEKDSNSNNNEGKNSNINHPKAHQTVTMKEGEILTFSICHFDNCNISSHETEMETEKTVVEHLLPPPLSLKKAEILFQSTVQYWRNWLSKCTYKGRWRESVYRSALVMKLFTYQPTGAIVASPTFGLPESIGGGRNWDYRYSWVRDSAFTIYAFLRVGFTQEAGAFIDWLLQRIQEPHDLDGQDHDCPLQIMYTIDGKHEIPEETLDHLEGYRHSRPVRIGNAAAQQLQLDIFGELMDSIYLYNKHGKEIGYDMWVELSKLIDWVAEHYDMKDRGIWEVRHANQPFVYSKLMCWVALDRGLRLAEKRSFPAPRQKWIEARDKIYLEIMTQGWNEKLQSFTQFYGSTTLDASNLLMPLVFFLSPYDPRLQTTLDAILKAPHQGGLLVDGLVYRYNTDSQIDGLRGGEGTFNMCTFWLVEALTRAGHLDEARLIFERMLSYANHVGLYAEETGTRGEALGNFPQAFTHLSLISSAYNLDRYLNRGSRK